MDGDIVKLEFAGFAIYHWDKKVFKTQTGWSKKPSLLFSKKDIDNAISEYNNVEKKEIYYTWND